MITTLASEIPRRWLTTLPDLGLIEVAGADGPKFLQGQATCDILALNETTSRLGAFCTPKGRVLTIFRTFQHDDRIYLIVPRALTADTVQRLKRYVLRAAASLSDVTEQWAFLGLNDVPSDFDFAPDLAADAVSHGQWGTALAIPSATGKRTLVVVPVNTRDSVVQAAQGLDIAPVSPDFWKLEDIRAGLTTVLPETVEAFIPQMLNLDLLGGIGFKKGCYTGQEVVARTHYLGTVKRRTYRLLASQTNIPTPGAAVYADGEEQSAGTVVCAAEAANGAIELLAVLNSEQAPVATLRLNREGSEPLVLASLPGTE